MINFGIKWWAIRLVCTEGWYPMKFLTLFGRPLSSILLFASGPFTTKEKAQDVCDMRNTSLNNITEG